MWCTLESYVIHTQLHDYGKYVDAKINHFDDAPQSVRECRFQAIGWILNIYEKLNALADDYEEVGQRGNIQISLIELASMDEEVSLQLVRANSWRERFEIVWPTISYKERQYALDCCYDGENIVNYWPGFDTYNHILLRHAKQSFDNTFEFWPPAKP